jgi:hypothetical protein
MPLIKTVDPSQAEGVVKEVYAKMEAVARFVPKPLQLMSANPGLLVPHSLMMDYYFNEQKAVGPLLRTYIRWLVALQSGYPYCIDLNEGFLRKMAGLADADVAAIRSDPSQAKLPANEKALLLFVLKAMGEPEMVDKADMDALHALGWEDPDIFAAAYHGTTMIAAGILFNAFKMGDV